MKEKNSGIPINQEEIQPYLKDIRKKKVMTPEREKQLAEQIKKMEDENKKLKDKFQFNSHLNRIQAMSSTVKLKF
jgi:cell shape-determining protein MreC